MTNVAWRRSQPGVYVIRGRVGELAKVSKSPHGSWQLDFRVPGGLIATDYHPRLKKAKTRAAKLLRLYYNIEPEYRTFKGKQ